MIDLHIVSGIYFVTLTNPATRNALNEKIMAGLEAALDAASGDASSRAVVLRGSQGSFCSGGDFAQFKALMAEAKLEPDPIAKHNRNFGRLLEKMIGCDVPLLALVEGAAMGGGVGLAAACDVVFATEDAKFAMPETTLGLPPAQIAPFVALRIGTTAARRLMLTAARLTASDALTVGLVDQVVDDGDALKVAALTWLNQLGCAEPRAIRATKAILTRARHGSLAVTLDFAADRFAAALRSGTAAEGIAAFSAKLPASWRVEITQWPDLPI